MGKEASGVRFTIKKFWFFSRLREKEDYKIVKKPLIFSSIPQEEFLARLNRQLQDKVLQDPEQQSRILEAQRNMDRDTHKSILRQNEFELKQRLKIKKDRICLRNNRVVLQKFDGNERLIEEEILFSFRIDGVWRFQRDGSDEIQWQVSLVLPDNNCQIRSPLYDEKILQSPTKLQKTLFAMYVQTVNSSARSMAFKWLSGELLNRLAQVPIKTIPSKAGWFEISGVFHCWSAEDEDTLLLNKPMKKYHVKRLPNLNTEEVVSFLLKDAEKLGKGYVSVLLSFLLLALLGRLSTNIPLQAGLTLIGGKSEIISKKLLCVMQSNEDVINLDSDRISVIREKATKIQDTPLIFISSAPDNKSTRNRLCEVMSWMNSGYIEGERVSTPYIFCLQKFSKEYPLDSTIVLDVSKMQLPDKDIFVPFQSLIISKIEEAGIHWVQELKKITKRRVEIGGRDKLLQLMQSLREFILRMFSPEECGTQQFMELTQLLQTGEEEIERQLHCKEGTLIEVFKNGLIHLVDENCVTVWNRKDIPGKEETIRIYYDAQHYYFTRETLQFICIQLKIDNKSILSLKQQLIEIGCAKTYKHQKVQGRDLEVDFLAFDTCGQQISLSGLAIKRDFWDEIGSISLFERGNEMC